MTDTDDNVDLEGRDAYVIFAPNRGFIKNKNKDFTDDFTHARIFGKREHADNSIKMGKLSAVVIPVRMELDPRQIFTAVLRGV